MDELKEIYSLRKRKVNQKINLANWTKDPLSLKLSSYPPNPVLKYEKYVKDQKPKWLEKIPKVKKNNVLKIFDMRKSAEAQRQVRRYIQEKIKPGVKLIDIANTIEHKMVELLGNSLKSGIGFSTGLSLNECAAHDTSYPGDNRRLTKNDVLKIDFGTHVNGYITDTAFTVAFDEKYKPLLDASKDGTWTGIKMAGVDARINEISAEIKEAIESYEIELNNKIQPIKVVTNLGGHSILPYKIHGGALILGSPTTYKLEEEKMKEDTIYAIETFASTGTGYVSEDRRIPTGIYMMNYQNPPPRTAFKLDSTRKLYSYIYRTRKTLPFCTRWLEKDFPRYKFALKELEKSGIIHGYPALSDVRGSYTSQLEHTIYLHEFGKEIMSSGDDY